MKTWHRVIVFVISQQLQLCLSDKENYKFKYLDEYGDDSSMLMKDGFIHSGCDGDQYGEDDVGVATTSTSAIVAISKPSENVFCGRNTGIIIGLDKSHDTNPCDYSSCNGVCKSDTIYKHRCPNFLRDRKASSAGGQKSEVQIEPWSFEYKALCTKGTTHARTATKTGSLCDYEFVDNDPVISITTATDCSNKFTVTYNGKVIQVSETVFAPKSKKLVLDTAGKTVTIEVYDIANPDDGTPNIMNLNGKTSPLNISTLHERKNPYKVVIKTTGAKHWFYLRPYDVFFNLSKTSGYGKATVQCTKKPHNTDVLVSAKVELFDVADGTSVGNPVETNNLGTFKCTLTIKTKKPCFPYDQDAKTITENQTIEVEPEDIATTTAPPTTTTVTPNVTGNATTPSKDPTKETTGSSVSPGPTVKPPKESSFNLYFATKAENKSADIKEDSKKKIEERCETTTANDCPNCTFSVQNLKTEDNEKYSYVATVVVGAEKGRMKRATVKDLGDAIKEDLKQNPMDIDLDDGKSLKLVGGQPAPEEDSGSTGLTTEEIVGIAVGCAIGIALIVVILVIIHKRRNKDKSKTTKKGKKDRKGHKKKHSSDSDNSQTSRKGSTSRKNSTSKIEKSQKKNTKKNKSDKNTQKEKPGDKSKTREKTVKFVENPKTNKESIKEKPEKSEKNENTKSEGKAKSKQVQDFEQSTQMTQKKTLGIPSSKDQPVSSKFDNETPGNKEGKIMIRTSQNPDTKRQDSFVPAKNGAAKQYESDRSDVIPAINTFRQPMSVQQGGDPISKGIDEPQQPISVYRNQPKSLDGDEQKSYTIPAGPF